MKKLILSSLLLVFTLGICAQEKKGIKMARYKDDDVYIQVNPRMKNNPEKSAGFYLKQSATYQGIAIGAVVSGGTLIGVLASSDEKNVRTSGYIAGGILCLGGFR